MKTQRKVKVMTYHGSDNEVERGETLAVSIFRLQRLNKLLRKKTISAAAASIQALALDHLKSVAGLNSR